MVRTAESAGGIRGALGLARSGIRRFFAEDRQLWLSFLIPFTILLVSYFSFGVYPVGEKSVLSLDLNGQYVYYYDYMYDVFAGKESVFYSWSRTLSGEFMGIIGYYLGSPFNFLVWMWPRECITEGLLTMMVTKVGAIGLCSAIYFSRGKGFNKLTTVIFSTCYALCAYTMEQTMNPMWLDGVMALPLVLYGIESLIDKGKFVMLTLSLTYSFVTCFYIGYMIGIFSAIYFFYYVFATHRKGMVRLFVPRGLLFTGVAAASVMMSAYMLLPVYKSLSLGKFDFAEKVTETKEVITNFDFIEILDKVFPGTYDTCRMSGLPFVYCGTVVLLMLPCYFFMKKIRSRDKIAAVSIIIVLCVSMYIKQTDMIWHGGQLPNWLPYRYSFMLTFMLVTFAATAFNEIKKIKSSWIAGAGLAWFAVLLLIEKADNYLDDISRDTMNGLTVVLPAMFVLFLVTATVIMMKNKLPKKSAAVVLVVIIGVETMYNTISQIYRQHQDIVYSTRPSYTRVILPTREAVKEIKAADDGFYRIEKTYYRTVNDPMALNMYGLSHSSSMLNARPIAMLENLGFTARSHYTRYSGATEITKSLFGVKYELSCPDNSTSNINSRADITVTENPLALPMAYVVDKKYIDVELPDKEPFSGQNELLSAMLGKKNTEKYFTVMRNTEETPIELVKTNVTQGRTTDGHHSFKVVEKGKNAELVYTLTMPETSALYMYLPTKYERTVNVWLNREKFLGTYFEGDNNSIMKIGDFTEGEQVIIGLTLKKDDLYFREAQFVICNSEIIEEDLSELRHRNSDTVVTRPTPTSMVAEVTAEEGDYLFTSIPLEEGWTVYVDGEKAEYETALNALLTVKLKEGRHKVEFRFTTAGYPLAIFISLAGAVIFACMIFIARIYSKKKKAALDGDASEYESPDDTDDQTSADYPGPEPDDDDFAPEDVLPDDAPQFAPGQSPEPDNSGSGNGGNDAGNTDDGGWTVI